MLEVCFSNTVKLNLLRAQHPQDPNDAGQAAISVYCTDGPPGVDIASPLVRETCPRKQAFFH